MKLPKAGFIQDQLWMNISIELLYVRKNLICLFDKVAFIRGINLDPFINNIILQKKNVIQRRNTLFQLIILPGRKTPFPTSPLPIYPHQVMERVGEGVCVGREGERWWCVQWRSYLRMWGGWVVARRRRRWENWWVNKNRLFCVIKKLNCRLLMSIFVLHCGEACHVVFLFVHLSVLLEAYLLFGIVTKWRCALTF